MRTKLDFLEMLMTIERLSVFNPELIDKSVNIYKSNAFRAALINKTIKKLQKEQYEKDKKYRLYYYLFDWANSPYSTVIITFIFLAIL